MNWKICLKLISGIHLFLRIQDVLTAFAVELHVHDNVQFEIAINIDHIAHSVVEILHSYRENLL